MVRAVVFKVALAAGLSVLAGCAASPEVSRATTGDLAPASRPAGYIEGVGVVNTGARSSQMERALSRLSRQFQRQTPYVITFDFNSATLDAEARRALDIQARWIGQHSDVRFAVAGHTDKVGNQAYNDRLGMRRAKAAVAYLVSKGIDKDRLVAMVSHGEDAPVIDTEDRERANRRVVTDVLEFIVTSDTPDRISRTTTPAGAVDVASNGGTGGNGGGDTGGNGGGNGGGTGGNGGGNGGDKDKGSKGGGSQANSGRGNGAEGGDPGNSAGRNKGGDND